MSDSDLSEAMSPAPSDSTLEKQLRIEVGKRFKAGTEDTMTVNEVRQAAEKSLGLDMGFYVGHSKWKAESKTIVRDEMGKRQAGVPTSPAVPPVPPVTSPAKVATRSNPVKPSKTSRPLKRTSLDDGGRARKRSKKSKVESESEDELSSPPSELEEEPEVKPKARPKPVVSKSAAKTKPANGKATRAKDESESPLSDSQDVDSESILDKPKNSKPEESESEMSVVIDEAPKPKRTKRKSSEAIEGGTKKPKASKSKAEAEVDPDDAEIKRLQGWLVKCGIRKMWWKELKPYESSKAKIKHLKDMLSDAGMTGRYSIEKATQIKEARELAADIEAVKEGAERWGKGSDGSEHEGDNKSKRRLVRGAKNYDFLSSDGEETD